MKVVDTKLEAIATLRLDGTVSEFSFQVQRRFLNDDDSEFAPVLHTRLPATADEFDKLFSSAAVSLNDQMREMGDQIANLKAAAAQSQADATAFQLAKTAAEQQRDVALAAQSALQAQLAQRGIDVEHLQASLAAATSGLTAAMKQNGDLADALATAKAQAQTSENDLSRANARITTLQMQVDALLETPPKQ